jgi:SsrA-binding protein
MEILLKNTKAHFNYETQNKFEAGISLFGFEVKSLKEHQGSINESYVELKGGEAYLVKAHIPPYQTNNTPDDYDAYRPRKLLLNKKELLLLEDSLKQSNLTVVPLSMYNKGRTLKLEIALAKGKKKFDKRESIKKRDIEKDLGRRLKN